LTPDAAPLSDRPERRDNGLTAPAYVPLADIDAGLADDLLDALRRARIAAYLVAASTSEGAQDDAEAATDRQRLYVAADERADARTIVQSAARAMQARSEPDAADITPALPHDMLDGVDTDAEFDALIAGWHIDTVTAVKQAERDLTREDADWRRRLELQADEVEIDDEEHYIPPPPPPLPRLAPMTVWALVVIALSLVMLGFGTLLGLPSDMTFLAGIAGLLIGAGMLVMRLRSHPDIDEDGDGAVI